MFSEFTTDLDGLINSYRASGSIFSRLMKDMNEALVGKLPSFFRVYPIDTGLGKTTLIKSFLAVWKANGFKPEGSVLIAFETIAEIEAFSATCGLDKHDYAAFAADEATQSLGLSYDHYNQARVLFTTHAMLRARLSKKSFAKAREFYYSNAPRTLRIWDEECKRADAIHLSVDELARLAHPLRPYYPEWIADLEAFIKTVRSENDGAVITVPKTFGKGRQFKYVAKRPPFLGDDLRDAVKLLALVGGKQLRICAGNLYGQVLIGSHNPLPSDLAPMLILDASARIGDAYQQWGKKADVIVMPPLIRDYGNLTVRICHMASGKAALEDEARRSRLLRCVAKLINDDPMPTLLIGRKAREGVFDLAAEVREQLDDPGALSFLNWGRHKGKNEYRDIERLVVIGMQPVKDTADKASYLAATGAPVGGALGDGWKATRKDRMKQNVLQAFSRGKLRMGTGGSCGKAVVYLIAPPNPDPEAIVREAFPGCKVEKWEPFGTILMGQAKDVFDAINGLVIDGQTIAVSKAHIRDDLGIGKSRFSHLLGQDNLKAKLASIGVTTDRANFLFDPSKIEVPAISNIMRRWRTTQERFAAAA